MLPEKYRRLWRRRLKRRPLLPFVLAAFLAVDAVIAVVGRGSPKSGALCDGFLAAQLGLLAIWITHARQYLMLRMVVGLCVAIVAAFCIVYDGPNKLYGPSEYLAITASVCVLLVATSSLTAGIVRLIARRLSHGGLHARQRLTIGGILLFTLFTALLVAVFRDARTDTLADPLVVGLVVAGVVPTLWISTAIAFLDVGWPRVIVAIVLPVAVTLPLLVAERSETLLPFFAQTVFCGLGVCFLDWRRQEDREDSRLPSDSALKHETTSDAHIDLKA